MPGRTSAAAGSTTSEEARTTARLVTYRNMEPPGDVRRGTYHQSSDGVTHDACATLRVGGGRVHQLSPNGRTSTRKDQADRSWWATCQISSAIARGAMKKSSGRSEKTCRVQGTSMTASMTT